MIKKNGELEKQIAIEKGNLYKGIPYITVVGDGGQAKRNYGHGFNSQSGVVIINIFIIYCNILNNKSFKI